MTLRTLLTLAITLLPFLATAAEYSVVRQYVYPVVISSRALSIENTQTAVGSGSMIVIAPGYALTAAHVVPTTQNETMYLMTAKREVVRSTPIKIDRSKDLALLAVNIGCPCAPIATRIPDIDEVVHSVGFPLYLLYGLQLLTSGTIQGAYDGNIMTTSVSAPGGSGGGLFYKELGEYKLIGISIAVAATPMGPRVMNLEREHNWLSFSVPVTTIRAFLKGSPVVIK